MKLYLNKTSPYARLVMVVAHEKGLSQIELVWTDPWANSAELLRVNPFAKVPVLLTGDGQPIVESACICDYLDQIGGAPRLLPTEAAQRLPVLRKYGMGRGLIDAAFGVIIERRFSGADSTLAARWLGAVRRAVDVIEQDQALLRSSESPDLGDLALAVGLSYVEFRLPELDCRSASPRLSKWLDRLAVRPSIRLSAPE